jgi:hypothetical protein
MPKPRSLRLRGNQVNDAERLEADLWAGIDESKRLGYNPTRFIQMVKQHGAVEATRMVVDTRHPAEGFVKLAWDVTPRRPDLTSEQLVLTTTIYSVKTW